MSGAAEPVGSLQTALAQAQRLLTQDPRLALAQADEILKVIPHQPQALLLQGIAWRAIGDELSRHGDVAGADAAYARYIRSSTKDPQLLQAASALIENRIPEAEARLREFLKVHPTDVTAIRMLAEVAARLRRYADAETLLTRCLELAPGFAAARHNYAVVLHRQNRPAEALTQIELLLQHEPGNPGYLNMKAAALAKIGEFAQSLETYAQVLSTHPRQPKVWMSYGHALKTANRLPESIDAYRQSIAQMPGLGEAYWSLANLKTFRFTPQETAAMGAQLQRPEIGDEDRYHLHFALGKAYEDEGRYAQSFEHYRQGNELRRAGVHYDADETTRNVQRSKRLFTTDFFAQRAGFGCPAADPIFIVSLPRSGSTLLEQILASHPSVEGTMELADISVLAKSLGRSAAEAPGAGADYAEYPEVVAALSRAASRTLGERYLEQTRIQRKSAAPFFVDKMPNNFAHIGFIQLILPNARIIDARRHPLACCFSGYKQHFARGQHFSYRLEDLGRYYRDYVELLAHYDRVLPGRIHRVFYESMIDDTEGEVRRLLAYCGLPFDERCLRFYETDRAVRTASSQQVRQPIFKEGLDQWRHYEPWLGALKDALGPVLSGYPAVPEF